MTVADSEKTDPTSTARPEGQQVSGKNGHRGAAAGPGTQAAWALDRQQNNSAAKSKWVNQVTYEAGRQAAEAGPGEKPVAAAWSPTFTACVLCARHPAQSFSCITPLIFTTPVCRG